MSIVVIGAGSNLGAREAAIRSAGALLDARPEIDLLDVSPLYETRPLGPPQGDYLNAAFRIDTTLTPVELLQTVLRVERRLGRTRNATQRWGPRSIDLDLLWDARGAHASAELQVPHPELDKRSFALGPLLDVAPKLAPSYGAALEAAGGHPARWTRAAVVREYAALWRLEREVEADSVADACALSASFEVSRARPWSTRTIVMEPRPERFAEVLREVLRTGFSVCQTTISHCSQSQWVAEFHGFNRGYTVGADVRLQTTCGASRDWSAKLVLSFAS